MSTPCSGCDKCCVYGLLIRSLPSNGDYGSGIIHLPNTLFPAGILLICVSQWRVLLLCYSSAPGFSAGFLTRPPNLMALSIQLPLGGSSKPLLSVEPVSYLDRPLFVLRVVSMPRVNVFHCWLGWALSSSDARRNGGYFPRHELGKFTFKLTVSPVILGFLLP